MKRFRVILTVLASAVILALSSCKETKEFDDHANWQQRNTDYIESIAIRCDLNSQAYADIESIPEGKLFKLLSFKLDPEKSFGSASYVYCEKLQTGNGTVSPQYTDSVRINYRVRLMPTDNYPEGQVVDQSFKTSSLDPSVNIPASLSVNGLIDGVTTALMYMHCGDYWKLYIPYGLAYGTSGKGTIPGYSALIFEVNLTEIAPAGEVLSPR